MMAEQASEASIIRERLSLPLEELITEGFCIDQASAFWLDATQFGLPVAVFSLGPGQTFGLNHFE